jgi:hypothetical protein
MAKAGWFGFQGRAGGLMRDRIWLATLVALLGVSCTTSSVAGHYVSERDRSPKDYVELRADGTFTLQEDGSTLTGTYKLNGTQVTLSAASGKPLRGKIEAGVLTDATGNRWTKQ